MPQSTPAPDSIWTPLHNRFFLALWVAQAVSNIGTWMQSTGAAWMMTGLDPSPVMVALVQTASSIPIFLVGVAAGAIADIVDRRLLLIVTQVWMLLSAAALAFLTFAGLTTPYSLLILTFTLGLGAAFMSPAFQAIFPDLVQRKEIPAAVTLNGVSVNIARSVGPALGGIIVALAGPGPVFLLNAISFVGVILVLVRWHPPARQGLLPREPLRGAMRMALRYARYAPELRVVLVRLAVFITFGSALWALMPLVARFELGAGADVYGILLAAVGVGSLIGAGLQAPLRRRMPVNTLVTLAELVFAASTVALGYLPSLPLLVVAMLAGGIAWLVLMANFGTMVQTLVPSWVQARALGVYVTVFMGGMAFSSILWGAAADSFGVPPALLIAGTGLLLTLPFTYRVPVRDGVDLDLSPALHWPDPRVAVEPEPGAGPVLVTIEYRAGPEDEEEFLALMQEMGRVRRRDGAIDWGVYRDMADPGLFVETYYAESWHEHLRQHRRITVADLGIEEKVRRFRIGESPAGVRHLISAYADVARPDDAEKE